MTEIYLANQRGVAYVDDADAQLVQGYKWRAKHSIKDRTTYAITCVNGKSLYMHRLLVPGAERVDHIDGNGLDNQRSTNLRPCTHRENMRNMRPQTGRRFKGVGWHKRRQRWRAYIGVDGVDIHLGYFDTEEEAAHAYDMAAVVHFGEFAYLNLRPPLLVGFNTHGG